MKSNWRIPLIVFIVLAVLIILIFPLAPLWQKMGIRPVCIQGTFPHLRFTPCTVQTSEPVTPFVLATPVGGPTPIIIDDDGSPDGTVAIMYFLKNPMFDVRAVTISYGEAHPEIFAPQIAQVFTIFGRKDIPVGYGRDIPLDGNNAFPESWRQVSDDFWNLQLPQSSDSLEPVPAAELIVKTVNSSEKPMTIFISGSHTNLAEAIRLDPGITSNISDVYIMGGSVYQPGNIHSDYSEYLNEVAEWNIWVDPLAASEVFNSGLSLHLIPLDATKQVVWTKQDLKQWSGSSSESKMAVDLVQWMLDSWSSEGVYIWDLAAAVQATTSAVCQEIPLGLEVITTPGLEQGRTQVVDRAPNVSVCLDPNPGQVKSVVNAVFQVP